jgi:hypothetical protein
MKRWLFLLWLCLACTTQATPLVGIFRYPNGAPVSGILTVTLTKPGLLNTCTIPAVVVPTTPVRMSVVNGSLLGNPDILPTDCLNRFQPYKAELRDGSNTLVFSQWWYIAFPGGATPLPTSGSKYIAQIGLNPSTLAGSTNPIVYQIAETVAGFRTGSAPITLSGIGDVSVTVSWNTSFPDTNYVMVCTYKDNTNSSTAPVYVASITSVTPLTVLVTGHKNTLGSLTGKIVCRGREP